MLNSAHRNSIRRTINEMIDAYIANGGVIKIIPASDIRARPSFRGSWMMAPGNVPTVTHGHPNHGAI